MARLHTLSLFCLLAIGAPAWANPPAPSYTLYGTVRAEDGRPLDTGEAVIVISTDVAGAEVSRGPTDSTIGRGLNYSLQIPMDSLTTSDRYKTTAATPKEVFSIQVVIGAKTYVPYAVGKPTLDTEQPGDRERFDFVIGLDSDNDGLPDTWEKALVDADPNDSLTSISQISANGDINGDGLTNYQEFIVGLYSREAGAGIFLDILELENGIAHLQILTARGRTYSIRTSTDLKTWIEVPFSLDPSGAQTGNFYRASDSNFLTVYVPGIAVQPAFFMLYVE